MDYGSSASEIGTPNDDLNTTYASQFRLRSTLYKIKRSRKDGKLGEINVDAVIEKLTEEISMKQLIEFIEKIVYYQISKFVR
ncbi:MAG: hypothetical protein LBH59_00870 [Planctomycetaceae bacterium]|nr:hypothetical protein [Planctomycetaceae bacterium]